MESNQEIIKCRYCNYTSDFLASVEEDAIKKTKEEVIKEIEKHVDCKEFHQINGMRATCLDIILEKLKEVK